MKVTNVQRYMQLRTELKQTRSRETEILDKMDLLWQAMTLDERNEVRDINPSWPPSAMTTKNEDDDGNG